MSKIIQPIRVLIADDHSLIRKSLRATLEDELDIRVVGEATNGVEVQQLVAERCPHVLVIDLKMPDTRVLEVATWVRRHYPDTIILVLTGHDEDSYLTDMIGVGVAGYIVKGNADAVIVEAVRSAARGEILFTAEQLARAQRWCEKVAVRWESLSSRERQVLQLLVKEGLDNAAIAERLDVTAKTAAYHVGKILEKLGVSSRLEAVAWVHAHVPKELYGEKP